jgi:hypothetical protein
MTVSHVGAKAVLNINCTFLSKEAEIIIVIVLLTLFTINENNLFRELNNNNNNMV